jgi:Tol biopolymer transport system component
MSEAMITCPHCGQQTRAAASFCTRCGKRREDEAARPTPAIATPVAAPQAPLTPQWSAPKPKRRRKLPLIVAGIVAVAAVVTGALVCCGDDGTPRASSSVPPGRIVFASDRSGNHDVFIANNDGTKVRNLTNSPSRDEPPATSPDGNHIAFRSDREETYEIFSMDADGRNVKRLTDGEGQNFWPTYSPDGEQIAFTRDRDGGTGIWIMSSDGSNARKIVSKMPTFPSYSVLRRPTHARSAFTSDGSSILFEAVNDDNIDIFSVSVSSGVVTQLTDDESSDRTPTMSPDGSTIVFTSNRSNENAMYTMGPDGSDPTRLSGAGSVPSFTPDGEHIIFTRNDDVWIMDAGGGNARPLMQSESGEHAPGWLS